MKFSREQQRTFIALACKLAWADGVVTEEERDFLRSMVERFASGSVASEELDKWLSGEVPEAEIAALPPGIDQLFVYESMRLMESDGELADVELKALEEIVQRVFDPHPKGTPLGRIAVAKRAIPLPKK